MFEGYLELGGGEVLNSARTLGYTKTAPCPINWLQCAPCDGVRDALGSDPYIYDAIDEAPWYDAEDEVTHRFLGASALVIEGIPDSTREADVAESILDGGVVGRVRRNTRRMRVRAVLSAIGEDALESGFAWLNSALSPGRCGTHADACGAADAQFFVACPPERTDITTADVFWNDPITNLITNPSFENPVTWSGAAGVSTVTQSTVRASDRAKSAHMVTTAATDSVELANGGFLVLDATTYTLAMNVWVPTGSPPVRLTAASGPMGVIASAASVQHDAWERLSVTFTNPTASGKVFFALAGVGAVPAGAEYWFDSQLVVAGDYSGPYFDGAMPSSSAADLETVGKNVAEYEWTGTADASTSTYRTGTVILVEDPSAYDAAVEPLVRNLHTVTCVSGPIVEQKMHRGDAWGYIVEFVLVAAVPWMFSVTKPVDLQPSLPIVVQDVPFNLVPYPSAELESGTVIAATNYSLNPSIESATTGWTVDTTAGGTVLSQSTELASAGLASAKATFTAAAAGSAGWFSLEHYVDLPPYVSGARYSFNEWASASVQSGTAVLGSLDIIAIWWNGTTYITEFVVGTGSASGGAKSAKSMLAPNGANRVMLRAKINMTSWSAGAVVRLYADAAAVSVP